MIALLRRLVMTIGTLSGEKSLGLVMDLCQRLRSGNRTLDELALFNEGRFGELAFGTLRLDDKRNFQTDSFGRIIVTVKATGRSGEEQIAHLESLKYRVSDYAKSVLRNPAYNQQRLEEGKEYQIALVRGTEIRKEKDRTTKALKAIGAKDYGNDVHIRTKAELACLLRETVSDEQLEKWGIWYIAILHDPIADSDGNPCVLHVLRDDEGCWLDARWGEPSDCWFVEGAFGFPLPEEKPLEAVFNEARCAVRDAEASGQD
ncbi:MAG TPA: hypothetical protein VM103_01780 [Candidatus Paceibacterota bacterium]|nr:hypothetical protein [Candidatus Paceibacterota bacterium]